MPTSSAFSACTESQPAEQLEATVPETDAAWKAVCLRTQHLCLSALQARVQRDTHCLQTVHLYAGLVNAWCSCSTLCVVSSEQLFSSDGDVCGDNSACRLNELSFIGNK